MNATPFSQATCSAAGGRKVIASGQFGDVSTGAHLGHGADAALAERRKIEAHHLVVGGRGIGHLKMAHAEDARRLAADDVAAPIDEFHQVARRAVLEPLIVTEFRGRLRWKAMMAEEQARGTESGGDQFLEAQRRRGEPAGEFGDEGHARLLDAIAQADGLGRIEVESGGAIDRLAGVAGGEDGERTVPLCGKHQHGVDVAARGKRAKAVDRGRIELFCDLLGAMSDLLADGADLEAVGEGAKRRPVAIFPRLAKAHQAYP
jgi:hypothetical protein